MSIRIALVTGGYTAEAEVSLKSADFVFQQLDKSLYDVYLITITTDSWFHVGENGVPYPVNRDDFSLSMDGDTIRFDLAFIMLHGSPGEDGRLQGYLDMVGLPYTSCDALTSALTMNKAYTKAVLAGISDLHVAHSVQLFASQRGSAVDMVREALSLPYFVKPNAGGSSIGMTKVKVDAELADAIDKAFDAENTGNQVIVEEFVDGREFSVGIYRSAGELVVLPASEVITEREFFDFEAKYIDGQTQEITPAELTAEQRDRIDRVVKAIYTRLNCKGMVRVDFFLERSSDRFYFIEINTIPGQTAQSFIPQQVRAAGMTETAFYGELIEEALRKG
ncbi:D-alanine--D-alanine ligase [Parapedobacter sp. 10938]|uniref:D-alanine--D-alanine ligase n=1 Tax=Parapedobacter flavus TaxID=3110225 RepID=UPI002DB8A4B3|nr:D-alanine--D-alanine ligase [Parapedobacter sp. 10938]MEC3881379.1 D-alanine--D-alanine ligase [Parapedobacter sp. 10938]